MFFDYKKICARHVPRINARRRRGKQNHCRGKQFSTVGLLFDCFFLVPFCHLDYCMSGSVCCNIYIYNHLVVFSCNLTLCKHRFEQAQLKQKCLGNLRRKTIRSAACHFTVHNDWHELCIASTRKGVPETISWPSSTGFSNLFAFGGILYVIYLGFSCSQFSAWGFSSQGFPGPD